MENQRCCLRIIANALPADNPMQSELCSHIGGQGNCMCRRCDLGGTSQEKEIGAGFSAILKVCMRWSDRLFLKLKDNLHPGSTRNALETSIAISEQLESATKGVAQTVKDLQTKTGVKDKIAQVFIDRSIDECRRSKKTIPHGQAADNRQGGLLSLCTIYSDKMNPLLTMQCEQSIISSLSIHT